MLFFGDKAAKEGKEGETGLDLSRNHERGEKISADYEWDRSSKKFWVDCS